MPKSTFQGSCALCGYIARSKGALSRHMREHTRLVRDRGGRYFGTNSHLNRHEKPFSCRICGAAFRLFGSFREHMKDYHSTTDQVVTTTSSQPLPGGKTVTCTTHTITDSCTVTKVSKLTSPIGDVVLVSSTKTPHATLTSVSQGSGSSFSVTESTKVSSETEASVLLNLGALRLSDSDSLPNLDALRLSDSEMPESSDV